MAIWSRRSKRSKPDSEAVIRLLLREGADDQPDWLWEIDAQRRIVDPSDRMCQALGMTVESLAGQPILKVLSGPNWEKGDFAPGLRALADKLKDRSNFKDLLFPVTLGGVEKWLALAADARTDPNGNYIGHVGVASDVTAQRDSADKINRLARYDDVTGLPNKLQIGERLERALTEQSESLNPVIAAVIFSNYSIIKEDIGFLAADDLLKKMGQKLMLVSPEIGVGFRYPEQFFIMWPNAPRSGEDLRKEINNILDIFLGFSISGRQNVRPNIVVGAATREDGSDANQLIALALERAYSQLVYNRARGAHSADEVSLEHHKTSENVESDFNRRILERAPAAREGVRYLISDREWRLNNGPPEAIEDEGIRALHALDAALSDLIELARTGAQTAPQIGVVRKLAQSVFNFCKDTGDLLIAGIVPLLASVPMALGTMVLIQEICDPKSAAVLAPGSALAIVAGYFSLEAGRRDKDKS